VKLPRSLNKIKSVTLGKAYCYRQIGDLTVSAAKCLGPTLASLPYHGRSLEQLA